MTIQPPSVPIRLRSGCCALLVGLGLAAPLAAEQASQARVDNAWMREVPPGQTTSAGFLTLHNEGSETLEWVAVEAEIAGAVEMHTMSSNDDGQMTMRKVSGFDVAPGEQRELAPRGDHLMLIRVRDTLQRDDQHSVTLRFSDGSALTVEMTVRAN